VGQSLGQPGPALAPAGDLENEVLAQLGQAAEKQLVLLSSQIVAGVIGDLAIFAQSAPGFPGVRMPQQGQDILAAAGNEIQVPLHPGRSWGSQPRLGVIGQGGFDRRQAADGLFRGSIQGFRFSSPAVKLHHAHMLRVENAGGGVNVIRLGVVQAAHRCPLLLQQVIILTHRDRHGCQFGQGYGAEITAACSQVEDIEPQVVNLTQGGVYARVLNGDHG